MNRTVIKILCIVSGILFVIFTALTILSVTTELKQINQRGGIIGGADAHTVTFLVQKTAWFDAAILAVLAFAATGLMLIFGRKQKR